MTESIKENNGTPNDRDKIRAALCDPANHGESDAAANLLGIDRAGLAGVCVDRGVVGDGVVGGVGGGGDDDPFAIHNLRLSQDFRSEMPVRHVLTVVPCRKPQKHEFVRVHPSDDWQLETLVYEDKANQETCLVDRRLQAELAKEVSVVCLRTAMTRQGGLFLWPLKLPGATGRSNAWNDSAIEAARIAETQWTRVTSNMDAGIYDTMVATAHFPEPEWPDIPFNEILRLCFRDRFIRDLDHPTLRALRGEV